MTLLVIAMNDGSELYKRPTMTDLVIETHDGSALHNSNTLGVVDIEIVGLNTVVRGTPNSIIPWALEGFVGLGEGFHDLQSDLSGDGAVFQYRSDQVRLLLTIEKLLHLLSRNLSAEDYFALLEKHGSFFEIHDDFYDYETGQALQPL